MGIGCDLQAQVRKLYQGRGRGSGNNHERGRYPVAVRRRAH